VVRIVIAPSSLDSIVPYGYCPLYSLVRVGSRGRPPQKGAQPATRKERPEMDVTTPTPPPNAGRETARQVRHREFHFPVEIDWEGGRRTTARVEGKQPVQIATPPEFRGTDPDLWSPEDALVAAAASCLVVTIAALAERHQLPLHDLAINANGVVGRRPDGRFGFTRIEQTVELQTDPGHDDDARALVAKAEDGCLVTVSLDLPVHTTVEIRTP
jgi:peroxiredoxin-like protein